MKSLIALALVFALQTSGSLALGAESAPPAKGTHRVATDVGGGSAADVLNMRSAPEGGAAPSAPAMKIEITCVDDAGQRYDSRDAGYAACLSKKGKK